MQGTLCCSACSAAPSHRTPSASPSWGKEHRKTLLHLAEVVQVLGFPRTDAEGAEELSKAIGTAIIELRNII